MANNERQSPLPGTSVRTTAQARNTPRAVEKRVLGSTTWALFQTLAAMPLSRSTER